MRGIALLVMMMLPAVMRGQEWSALVDSARADVAWLTSTECAGRGYLPPGDSVAARHIVDVFRRCGVEPIGRSYLHPVDLPVHLFTSLPRLVINGRLLEPGREFLPDPRSGPGLGLSVPYTLLDHTSYGTALFHRDTIAVIDAQIPVSVARHYPIDERSVDARVLSLIERGAAGVIVRSRGLTHSISGDRHPVPVLVARDTIPITPRGTIYCEVADTLFTARSSNVVGVIRGSQVPDSFLLVMAHYDHLGTMGPTLHFPGANDNASGTAMLLAMARHFSQHPLRYSLVLFATTGEEAGLHGSIAFFRNPPIDLKRVRFLLNMDMTASGSEGVMAQGGVENPAEFAMLERLARENGVDTLRKRENSPNSDHYLFLRMGIPGFYLYPFTGRQPYHSIDDRPETLEWNVWERIGRLAFGMLRGVGG